MRLNRHAGVTIAGITLLLMAGAPPARSQEIKEALLAWERPVGTRVVALAVSPDGRCVVAETTTEIVMFGGDGEVRWRRPHLNPWMAASAENGWEHAVAVAPGCRWMIVAGSENYHYVWLLGADGQPRAHIATPGTPQSVAISHRGDAMVVGTAAGHLLFANSQAQLLRDTKFKWGVFKAVEFSPDDALVLTSVAGYTVGLFTRDGETVWTREGGYINVWPTADWERFVVKTTPWHGIPIDAVDILARDGKVIWQRQSILAAAVQMADDGSRFVVSSALGPDDDDFLEYASSRIAPITLDRYGNALPAESHSAEEVPPAGWAGRCVSKGYDQPLVCRDRNGKALWQVSDILGQEVHGYATDLTFVGVARATGATPAMRAYRAPTADMPGKTHITNADRPAEPK